MNYAPQTERLGERCIEVIYVMERLVAVLRRMDREKASARSKCVATSEGRLAK